MCSCPAGTPDCALPASLHPTRQGSESKGKALWYLQPHQEQHHSSTQPVPGSLAGIGMSCSQPMEFGVFLLWHKA